LAGTANATAKQATALSTMAPIAGTADSALLLAKPMGNGNPWRKSDHRTASMSFCGREWG
jgi:hypothetical protein